MTNIPDKLWDEISILLPKEKQNNTIGRPIVPYRKVLDDIMYILRTGCQWKMLPRKYGSGSTSHRRYQEWVQLDIFKKMWVRVLQLYDDKEGIKWTWQSLDSISIKSPLGGAMTGNNPTMDRSKLGTKRDIVTDEKGIPLSIVVISSAASTHDVKLVTDVVDNAVIKRHISSPKTKDGRKRKQQHLCLDKAYNSKSVKQEIIKRGYVPHLPHKRNRGEVKKETEQISNRKKHPARRWWVVERTSSWHNRFRKLFTRYEKKIENYLGLVQFSCCIIIYRKLILG
ncbi:MAG: IS5 family transposase [Candidatus Nitrosocosmicus sp.]